MLIYTGVRLQKLICKSAVQALRLLTGLGPQTRSQKSLKLTVYVNKALASSLSYDKLFHWKKDLSFCSVISFSCGLWVSPLRGDMSQLQATKSCRPGGLGAWGVHNTTSAHEVPHGSQDSCFLTSLCPHGWVSLLPFLLSPLLFTNQSVSPLCSLEKSSHSCVLSSLVPNANHHDIPRLFTASLSSTRASLPWSHLLSPRCCREEQKLNTGNNDASWNTKERWLRLKRQRPW